MNNPAGSTAKSPTETTAPIQVARYSYYALGVLTGVNFLNYIDRQVLPAVAYAMKQDPRVHLTDTEIGAMEAGLLLSFTVLAPLFGRLGDRYSRTKLMAGAAVVWSVATGLTALTDHSPWLPPSLKFVLPISHFGVELSGVAIALCLVRALVGVGESSYSTITPTLIADYFPPQRRATALGIFQAAIPMGFALGYVLGGVLAHFLGWRIAFMVVGLPGMIAALIVWRLREPVRGASDTATAQAGKTNLPTGQSPAGPQEPWLRTCWRIVSTRDWLLSTAGYTALTFVLGAFGTWASLMLIQEKHMSDTAANVALGITVLFAGAAGTFGGGWIADRFAARRHNGYFLVCAASSFLGIIPAVLALVFHEPIFFLPAIFLAIVFLFSNNAPFHAILVGSVPPEIRASAMALNIVAIHACGDVISRLGVGLLSDSIGAGHFAMLGALARSLGIDPIREHLTAALLVVPFALLGSSLFFLWGARKRTADRRPQAA